MTEQDKQLLLKDLCARLPYGVIVDNPNPAGGMWDEVINIDTSTKTVTLLYDGRVFSIDDVKPYLRPMSSMTEEEKKEVKKLSVCDDGAFHNDIYDVGISMEEAFNAISWFLERHFDINYLIQKGLALEAPERMYKSE